MSAIKVHDKEFEIYLTESEILSHVKNIADAINKDYEGRCPLFIAILNGSFIFAADLFKHLTIDTEISFIKLASYKGMKSTGHIITSIGLDADLFEKDIVILEDIVDTGKTLYNFIPRLKDHHPASIKIAALLHKPEATKFPLTIDYTGFSIPDKFVIGYGLDYDGLGRNFREIYQVI
jgi:hypoxanthine phosphoribosyltransferase